MVALPPATADHSSAGACGAHELCECLFPHLRGLYVEQVQPAGAGVVLQAHSRAAGRRARPAARGHRGCTAVLSARWPTARPGAAR
jgi:hypothetical protein